MEESISEVLKSMENPAESGSRNQIQRRISDLEQRRLRTIDNTSSRREDAKCEPACPGPSCRIAGLASYQAHQAAAAVSTQG
jgi:hypothetical protein